MDSSSDDFYAFDKYDEHNCENFDAYKAFGVDVDFPQEMMDSHFRKLTKEFHPDVNKDIEAENRYKEITKASFYLCSPAKRKAYDSFKSRKIDEDPQKAADDLWAKMQQNATSTSSGSAPPRTSSMGTDISIQISIPYRLANLGGSHKIRYKDENGKTRNATLVIPQRIKSGKTLKIAGYGNSGSKLGSAGDLYVQISVDPPLIGEDVHKSIEISHSEARNGCIKELNFSRKKFPIAFKLKIPSGIENGKVIRVRNRGIPGEFGMPNGDAYIEIRVMPPKVGNDVNADAGFTLANEFYLGDKSIPFRQVETNLELGRITTPEIRKAVAKGNLLVEPVTVHKPGLAPNQEHVDVPGDLYLTIYPSIGLARFVNFLFTGILGFVIYEIIQFLSHVLN